MSIRSEAQFRLLTKIIASGDKGKTHTALLYEEKRYQGLGEEFTATILEDLVVLGFIEAVKPKRRFKTVSNMERYLNIRYFEKKNKEEVSD